MESIYDALSGVRYKDEKEICEKYGLFPEKEEWKGKILFIETCEEQPKPELLARELAMLRERGVFEEITGILAENPRTKSTTKNTNKYTRRQWKIRNCPLYIM